jgi:hypothetical protein
MAYLSVDHARCEALFASALQRSDVVTAVSVATAISDALRQFGPDGCASRMAQEFGEHPETACERMRWARQLVGDLGANQPSETSSSVELTA